MTRTFPKVGALLTAICLMAVVVLVGGKAEANHEPANKVSASGSTTEVTGPGEAVTILSEQVRTSNPTDLILSVSLECSITTDVTTIGSDDQTAVGDIKVWVEIDGVPVLVSNDDADGGRVTFCNRTYQRQTSLGSDDEQDSIRTFIETRSANAFNWMALDVGSAIHTIEVKAQLTTEATASASALAVIGNRTLIVEPTKAANDEEVSDL